MFYPKACRRCNGDLTDEEDGNGRYIRCMQCGWQKCLTAVETPDRGREFPIVFDRNTEFYPKRFRYQKSRTP